MACERGREERRGCLKVSVIGKYKVCFTAFKDGHQPVCMLTIAEGTTMILVTFPVSGSTYCA